MKKYIHISLVTVLLLGLSTGSAHAGDDKALAAIGGFVAGVITGVIVDDHHDHVAVSARRGYRGRYDCRDSHHHDRHGRSHRSGHWETRRVKVWVPGYWDVSYNHCGDRIKVWRRGHYEWRRERTWVAYGRGRDHYRGYRG